MRCLLCGCEGDTEDPFLSGLVKAVNPRTFRVAWLCGYCLEDELDNLKSEPASSPEYENRQDEYMTRFT
jgi:hypothetical protein